jgi:hypothetical protein
MKFVFTTWSIKEFLNLYSSGHLDLNPSYQRNTIWSTTAQRRLISTIKNGYPLPNFFVHKRDKTQYEMVDGQQRSRSILAYWSGDLKDDDGQTLSPKIKSSPESKEFIRFYEEYQLNICIIDPIDQRDIENFYVLVNSSGLRLNAPELRKAEYSDSRVLKLATFLANSDEFESLRLFTDRSSDRMNDIDFVSELLAFLRYGFSDKKEKVDELYKVDIDPEEAEKIKNNFLGVLNRIHDLEKVAPIFNTRFKQKNDFYTLFAFIYLNHDLPSLALEYYYATLLRLSPHIRPSQEMCEPLREYALNCVSQSNSKYARDLRYQFLQALFLNKDRWPNKAQSAIADYFKIEKDTFVTKWGFLLLPLENIRPNLDND